MPVMPVDLSVYPDDELGWTVLVELEDEEVEAEVVLVGVEELE